MNSSSASPDRPREECGVFGVAGHPEAPALAVAALRALQHRGQEGAGVAAMDAGRITLHKGQGLVTEVFREGVPGLLRGRCAIGHVRYSTTGSSVAANVQPLLASAPRGDVAIAHNGNIVNAVELRDELLAGGTTFETTTDTEVVLARLAGLEPRPPLGEALAAALDGVEGAFSIVALADGRVAGARDPRGFRPLWLGVVDGAFALASETCAFDAIGGRAIREVAPGEVVELTEDGVHSSRLARPKVARACRPGGTQEDRAEPVEPRTSRPGETPALPSFCAFEYIYFSRADSRASDGSSIYELRVRLGEALWREHPADADCVIPVPDSALAAATGYSRAGGIPLELGIARDHFIGRTFIQPTPEVRDRDARLKYHALEAVVRGRRLVLLDDSMIRGTTARRVAELLREAGAAEVHLRIASPPWSHPCFFGIDAPEAGELAANNVAPARLREWLGVDSAGFLPLPALLAALPGAGYCHACFSGEYPGRVPNETNAKQYKQRMSPVPGGLA